MMKERIEDKFGLRGPLLEQIDTHPNGQRRAFMREIVAKLHEIHEPGFELPGKAFYIEPQREAYENVYFACLPTKDEIVKVLRDKDPAPIEEIAAAILALCRNGAPR